MSGKWIWVVAGVVAVMALAAVVIRIWRLRPDDVQVGTELVRRTFSDVRHVSTTELAGWLEDPARPAPQLFDVRTEEEYAVSRIPGARRVDPEADADQVLAGLDPQRPAVFYCSIGYRSSVMARRLMKAGQENVFNLEGSIFAWANEGRPLESGGQPTEKVHPYNSHFGRLLHEKHRANVPAIAP